MKSVVNKPWGSFEIIDEGNKHTVKKLLFIQKVNFRYKAMNIVQSIG